MLHQSRRPFIALAFVIGLTVAFSQSMTLAQTPGGATITTSETEVQEDTWKQLWGLQVGTRVRVTVEDGAEIEGELVEVRTDALVLRNNRLRKGQLEPDAAISLNQAVTFGRADVVSVRAPAWAQSATHRDANDFLYDVVDVGFGQTPGGLRRVWSRGRSSLAIRSSGPGFWLALRITNLSRSVASRHLTRFPMFLAQSSIYGESSFSAIDDAKNEYSVRRVTVEPAVHADIADDTSEFGFSDRRGDYAPGAFSIELLHIPASELIGGIGQLHLILNDSTSTNGQRTRRVFSIKNPRSLKRDFEKRDFDYVRNPTADGENLPVEARTFTSLRRWDSAKGRYF